MLNEKCEKIRNGYMSSIVWTDNSDHAAAAVDAAAVDDDDFPLDDRKVISPPPSRSVSACFTMHCAPPNRLNVVGARFCWIHKICDTKCVMLFCLWRAEE